MALNAVRRTLPALSKRESCDVNRFSGRLYITAVVIITEHSFILDKPVQIYLGPDDAKHSTSVSPVNLNVK